MNNIPTIQDVPAKKDIGLFSTPILFIIFNRPDATKRVFETIRKIKPAKLYITADGPRFGKDGEVKLCEEARQTTEAIDWPCEVYRKYSDSNLGCKIGVSRAITWFFDNVEEGIILEDDCLPDMSFFPFCQELLSRYRNIDKVKMISGSNFQFGKKYGNDSYYFSNFPSIWGWATWRRAWKEYDIDMESYPDFKKNNRIALIFKDKKVQKYWLNLFDKLINNRIDTWDGQWVYSIYNNNGIAILPNVNLISNIGFNENATHTKKSDNVLNNIPTETSGFIIHPETVTINEEGDKFTFETIFYKSFLKKIISKIRINLNCNI